ncbi:MAG: enoyl-CoA hydratase, partial [Clostridia bacterium]|nr:enoyl-CoA hydratase [Clostridia bacterium]
MSPLSDWKASYRKLKFAEPSPGVLEIVLDNPGRLNSVDTETHTELTYVWRDIDADETIAAVLVRGAGNAFS